MRPTDAPAPRPRREGGCPVQAKFAATRRELADALIERDEEIDLVLTALLAREHPLLVGPPGTAKSLLLDSLLRWTCGTRFSLLLTKFTTPEEVFGPISVAGLKEDRYRRVTTGKLPEAELAFLDEIFKASSAILNTLLRVLNEGTFENGDGAARPVPLQVCVAASNEWPQAQEGGKELAALFDRFLLRKTVRPILSASGRKRLLWERDHLPRLSTRISAKEVEYARGDARILEWSDEGREALEQVLHELGREGIRPGDRRQYKAVGVAQAFAYLQGADKVEPEHLEVLAHVLWDDPAEQPEKAAAVIARVANPAGMRVNQLLLEAETILSSSDTGNIAQAASATAKLGEIARQLAGLRGGGGRAERAQQYVREQIKRIKLASIESI
jgi:MoxR-like ATPase